MHIKTCFPTPIPFANDILSLYHYCIVRLSPKVTPSDSQCIVTLGPSMAFSRSGSVGDNVGGPVVIVPTFTVTINPMEDDEESYCSFGTFLKKSSLTNLGCEATKKVCFYWPFVLHSNIHLFLFSKGVSVSGVKTEFFHQSTEISSV